MIRRARFFAAPSLAVLAGLLTLAAAQPGIAQDVPFTGIIAEETVEIHCGPSKSYYKVGELKKGQLVDVQEVIFGWNKIVPPDEMHSYISRGFVDVKGTSTDYPMAGRVNSDNRPVKAGSLKGPGHSYKVQIVLNGGDSVNILGEEGSYYKITPPAGAFVFLPPGSVRRASAMEAAEEVVEAAPPTPVRPAEPVAPTEPATPTEPAAPAEPTEPAEAAPAEPQDPAEVTGGTTATNAGITIDETPAEPAGTDPTPAEPAAGSLTLAGGVGEDISVDKNVEFETEASSELVSEVESKMEPLWDLPLAEQPIDEMLAAYEKLGTNPALSAEDRRIVAMRVATLKRNKQLAAALKQIEEARQQVAETEEPAEAAAAATSPAAPPPSYDAVGKLLASSLYDGRALPRMYRLVDPTSGRTVAYVVPGDELDPAAALNEVIGIQGKQEYDAALKLNVIQVKKYWILGAE